MATRFSPSKTRALIDERCGGSVRALSRRMEGDPEVNRRQLHKWLRTPPDHEPTRANVEVVAAALGVKVDAILEPVENEDEERLAQAEAKTDVIADRRLVA